jgi:aspartate aminotransferase-like enzyme
MVLFPENEPVRLDENVLSLLDSGDYGSLALVHCETTSGLFNPIEMIGEQVKAKNPNLIYIVDAMSSFGGVEVNFGSVDFLISSANKCLQGVPGFAFVISNKKKLIETKGDISLYFLLLSPSCMFSTTPDCSPSKFVFSVSDSSLYFERETGGPIIRSSLEEQETIVILCFFCSLL